MVFFLFVLLGDEEWVGRQKVDEENEGGVLCEFVLEAIFFLWGGGEGGREEGRRGRRSDEG